MHFMTTSKSWTRPELCIKVLWQSLGNPSGKVHCDNCETVKGLTDWRPCERRKSILEDKTRSSGHNTKNTERLEN